MPLRVFGTKRFVHHGRSPKAFREGEETDFSKRNAVIASVVLQPESLNVRCIMQFFVAFLGCLSDPFKWLSDLQLGMKRSRLESPGI